jgi:histidinol dehydrogenase
VLSRRSGGLSLGVNLFPYGKVCAFDCPYCEIFLEATSEPVPGADSLIAALEREFAYFLDRGYAEAWAPAPVRDICISGNGEPTMSPSLGEAVRLCSSLKASRPGILSSASLVLITNSTGFLDPATRALLEDACREKGLVIWAKLDAGSEARFRLMSGSDVGLERIADGLLSFARRSSVIVQTMLCEVDGIGPSDADIADYAGLLSRLAEEGARIGEAHLYTFSRPSPGGRCVALADEALLRAAAFVRGATGLRVRVFGLDAELRSSPAESPRSSDRGPVGPLHPEETGR